MNIDAHNILLQRDPFVAVDTLIHYDKVNTVTETAVDESCPFLENGKLSSCGMIENIAQTCAARIGYINKYILKKDIEIGFLVSVKSLKIYAHASIGDKIMTSVKVIAEMFGMMMAEAQITQGEKILAEGQMQLAIKEGL